jgi:hypothetical protein
VSAQNADNLRRAAKAVFNLILQDDERNRWCGWVVDELNRQAREIENAIGYINPAERDPQEPNARRQGNA